MRCCRPTAPASQPAPPTLPPWPGETRAAAKPNTSTSPSPRTPSTCPSTTARPSGAAFATALRRAQRLADDPAGAVWYGARRIFAFALMIRDGIPGDEVEPYLHARVWLTDAARLLESTPEALAAELVDTMLRGGVIVLRGGRLHAAAEHTPVAAETLRVPFPRAWPVTAPTRSEAAESQGHLLRTRGLR